MLHKGLNIKLVKKARGRIGNHIWLLMQLICYELKYGGKSYITEDTRWILDQYFKGYEKETYQTAELNLCGYKEFYHVCH